MSLKKLTAIVICSLFSLSIYAADTTYSAYDIGQALGKASHKSFDAMNDELNKQDFVAGFDDTILNQKPNFGKLQDKDSYEVGVIIASQYKSKLKKMIVINASNSKEFVNGFDSAAGATNFDLTAKDKQILKHFKVSKDEDSN